MTAEQARIADARAFPTGTRALVGVQRAVEAAGLEPLLLDLRPASNALRGNVDIGMRSNLVEPWARSALVA
jgi:hypothetical protein